MPSRFRFSKIQISNFHFGLKEVYFCLILLPGCFATLIYFKALFSLFSSLYRVYFTAYIL